MKKITIALICLLLFANAFAKKNWQSGKIVNAEQFGLNQANADNSKALQKAIDKAGNDTSSKVIIPAGVFRFKQSVILKNSTIVGSPAGRTVFVLTEDFMIDRYDRSPRKGAFLVNAGFNLTFDLSTANTVKIQDIDLISNVQDGSNSFVTILMLANVKSGFLRNCNITANPNNTLVLNTPVDFYACVKNVSVTGCRIINLDAKAAGGCMWIRNKTSDGGNQQNNTENIMVNNVTFRNASGDEALAIFGGGGLTKNVKVDNCKFYGLSSPIPHSTLLSIFALNDRPGEEYSGVQTIKILNSLFVDSSYIDYIVRVGRGKVQENNNVVDDILISGNDFQSFSRVANAKSSIIRRFKNKGDNITASNNKMKSDSLVNSGFRGFDNVIGNTIIGDNIQIGINEANGVIKNNSIRAKVKGITSATADSSNKVTIVK